jgi:hypothetical protein
MNPSKAHEFRQLLLQYTKEIPETDAQAMLEAIELLEKWVDDYVNDSVTVAIERHKKNNNGQ